jgi:hypothetical protein
MKRINLSRATCVGIRIGIGRTEPAGVRHSVQVGRKVSNVRDWAGGNSVADALDGESGSGKRAAKRSSRNRSVSEGGVSTKENSCHFGHGLHWGSFICSLRSHTHCTALPADMSDCRTGAFSQGHLVKGEDTEAFSSLLWTRNCTSKTVGANPNLRPHLK